MTPHDPVTAFLAALSVKDFARLRDVLAPDAVQEMPYAPPGFPEAFVGRDAIVDHFRAGLARREGLAFTVASRHDLAGLSVVEFDGRSLVAETGRVYAQRYIGYFFHDGTAISRLREYFNPLRFVAAFDGVANIRRIMDLEGGNASAMVNAHLSEGAGPKPS